MGEAPHSAVVALRSLFLALAISSVPAEAASGPECGLAAGIDLVGLDTAAGEALFALSAAEGDGSYLVAWRQGSKRARLLREPKEAGRFGGSIGPGAVFAFAACGRGCLQPLALEPAGWEPLGESILAPQAATVHGTYDLAGTPWVVIHGTSPRAGFMTAWAFRLVGREWRPSGRLEVTAAAAPGALPAPWYPAAVVSGSGLFAADAEPRAWVSGLPAGRTGPGAMLLPFDRQGAAFVSPEGSIYRSSDAGGSWQLTSWRPWETGTAEPWRRGTDYSLDLPTGVPASALPVVWFDRRIEGREGVVFSEMSPAGRWRRIATGPARLATSAGEDLTVGLVLRGPGDRWSTVFGCVVSRAKPRLVVVEVAGGEVGETTLIPLE
jgi:hypothetical protein